MLAVLSNWSYSNSNPNPRYRGFIGDWTGLPLVGKKLRDGSIADVDVAAVAWPVVWTKSGFSFQVEGNPRWRSDEPVAHGDGFDIPALAFTLEDWGIGCGDPDKPKQDARLFGRIPELPRGSRVDLTHRKIASIIGRVVTLRTGEVLTLGAPMVEREDEEERVTGRRFRKDHPLTRCGICGKLNIRGYMPSVECKEHQKQIIDAGDVWGQ